MKLETPNFAKHDFEDILDEVKTADKPIQRATFGKAGQSALPSIPKLELPCKKDSVSGFVAFKKSKSVLTHVKMVKKPTNKNANNFKGPKSSRSVA